MPDLFYYPKINAPRSVIYQAVLYWDRLVTVAPPGPLDHFLGPRMRQLNDAGLYLRLPADEWPGGTGVIERTLWTLTRLLDEIPADDLVPDSGPDSYVHRGKFSPDLIEELRRRGLARSSGLAVYMSAATQLCLISAAARELALHYRHSNFGDRDAGYHYIDSLYPYTDSPAAHRFAHSPFAFIDDDPGPEGSIHPRRYRGLFPGRLPDPSPAPCLDVEIGGLLPVPGHDVLIEDLIAFREKYSDERRRLITAIDRLVRGLQRDYGRPRDVFHALQGELERALADLEHAGRCAKINWVRRAVTVSIALASGYAGQQLYPELGWFLGVIGGAAINVATTTTRAPRREFADDITYLQRTRSAVAGHS
ncbi:hypothetical protein [Nocardia cyriacigeorgica]|uniref:hypothetical protein n=1 Tax=Nocardia cyriacigeorgica TaxID=135487 RepID=UPI001892ECAE|nr:hypothetical protein [Nocardia cyriacigeorgica]MBF6437619.1 hypothetical protein [Nocardia cyriacigeorgica]